MKEKSKNEKSAQIEFAATEVKGVESDLVKKETPAKETSETHVNYSIFAGHTAREIEVAKFLAHWNDREEIEPFDLEMARMFPKCRLPGDP